jgi:hypothetical protein
MAYEFLDWAFYWGGGAGSFLARPGATAVRFDRATKKLTITFSDGVELAVPHDRLLGVDHAGLDQLGAVELDETGTVVRWPQLEVALSIPTLFGEIFASRRRLPSGREEEWAAHLSATDVKKLRKKKHGDRAKGKHSAKGKPANGKVAGKKP